MKTMSLDQSLKNLIEEIVRRVMKEELFILKPQNEPAPKPPAYSPPSHKEYDPLQIIRPKELAKLLSVSIPTLWRMEKTKRLPPKISISSRSTGWLRKDIEDWISDLKAKSAP